MIQLKGIDRLCIPDPKTVDHVVAITHDRQIHRYSQYRLIPFLNKVVFAAFVLNPHIAAELDRLCVLRAAQLKGIAVLQPHIRHFHLIAILNFLFEHPVAVTDAAAVRRISKCCQRGQKAGCQTSQTAVAKSRIRLLIFDYIQIQPDLF